MRNLKFVRTAAVTAVFAGLTLAAGAIQNPNSVRPPKSLPFETFHNSTSGPETRLETEVPETVGTDNSNFYSVRPDYRRCVSPLCGGYFVKRVNQSRTRCVNGRLMSECYVAEIDWNGQPQVKEGSALVRGAILLKRYPRFGNLGSLRVEEFWQAATDREPAGDFYRVRDRGVRCITTPCPTHEEAKLNTGRTRNISGVNINSVGASNEKLSEALAAMTRAEGVIVAGNHTPVTGPGGRSVELQATQFYVRANAQADQPPITNPPPAKKCFKTGCSNQVCADHNVVTTCEFRPEYACYQRAACERQSDGHCGFTRTAELDKCLSRARR